MSWNTTTLIHLVLFPMAVFALKRQNWVAGTETRKPLAETVCSPCATEKWKRPSVNYSSLSRIFCKYFSDFNIMVFCQTEVSTCMCINPPRWFPFQMVHQLSIAFIQHFVFAPPVRNTALSVSTWLGCGPLASSVYFGTNATIFKKFYF